MGKINNSLAKQIKKLAEDLNANGELTSDVEIIIEPEVKDDALNYCDSCDKTSEECICDNEDDCDCSDDEIDEKEYTDADALKDHKRIINKVKDRIKALKDDIKSDMEMIKDKEEKMKTASDVDGKHGVPSPKKMYANNIKRLKERVAETQKTIKEVQDELKDRLAKHKEAEADLKK